MEDIEIKGIISREMNKYILITDEGEKYTLYAINPWEAVPVDFDTAKFEKFIGEEVKVSGRSTGTEIWNALVHCENESDTIPPSLDDLIIKKD